MSNHIIYPFTMSTFSNDRLEAAMQRLTNLCSVLNDMEPICVLNHVFVLREVGDGYFFSSSYLLEIYLSIENILDDAIN